MIIWRIGDDLHALSKSSGIRSHRPGNPAKSDNGNGCSEWESKSILEDFHFTWLKM